MNVDFLDNKYYIPVNATLFPAGAICCIRIHVWTLVHHREVRILVAIVP